MREKGGANKKELSGGQGRGEKEGKRRGNEGKEDKGIREKGNKIPFKVPTQLGQLGSSNNG